MGTIYQVICNKCNRTDFHEMGSGFAFKPESFESGKRILISDNIVLSSLHYRQQKKVEAFLRKSDHGKIEYVKKSYTCPKCNRFYSRTYVKIESDIGIFKINYKCVKCRTSLSPIDIETEIDKCKCFGCGEKGLTV